MFRGEQKGRVQAVLSSLIGVHSFTSGAAMNWDFSVRPSRPVVHSTACLGFPSVMQSLVPVLSPLLLPQRLLAGHGHQPL